jgi:3'-phosphoadenosine 5'-phosphosulfate sulfotransferase (PAPS reductase)/FAD synthetase
MMKNKIIKKIEKPVICWWSGGVTSAVACKLTIDFFGKNNCKVIFIDTRNEDDDTYRFKDDCSKWYELEIESISSKTRSTIQEVWEDGLYLNVAGGAPCSSQLKKMVREYWERRNSWSYQVFGFELSEWKRAKSLLINHSHTNPIFPLMMFGLSKEDCIKIIQESGLEIPRMYQYGFRNNNCFKTGCVQGGIGYWQKMKKDFPDKFNTMAEMEHKLTNKKGSPVTMLKDQSKKGGLVFLKKHKDYPDIKEISEMKGREVKPLVECNGLCGVNDLSDRNPTEKELNNYQQQLF